MGKPDARDRVAQALTGLAAGSVLLRLACNTPRDGVGG